MTHRGAGYGMGVFWSFLSALLWSSTFVVARYLLGEARVDPLTLSFLRFAIGAAALLALGWRRHAKDLRKARLKDLPSLAGLALFGIVGMSSLLFWGQQSTTAINASLIMQVCPIMILLGGVVIGERITPRQALGIPMSFIGCLMVVEIIGVRGLRFDTGHLGGDLLVLGAAGCWAVYTLGGKGVVLRLGGYTTSALTMLCGAVELGVMLFLIPVPQVWPAGVGTWAVVLYLALLPTAVAFYAWYEALGRIELSLLNVMQYLTPVFTIFLAALLLGERVGCFQGFGIALVLAGVAAIGRGKR